MVANGIRENSTAQQKETARCQKEFSDGNHCHIFQRGHADAAMENPDRKLAARDWGISGRRRWPAERLHTKQR